MKEQTKKRGMQQCLSLEDKYKHTLYNSIQLKKEVNKRLNALNISVFDVIGVFNLSPIAYAHWYRYGISHQYIHKSRSISIQDIERLLLSLAISVKCVRVDGQIKSLILVDKIEKCTITKLIESNKNKRQTIQLSEKERRIAKAAVFGGATKKSSRIKH